MPSDNHIAGLKRGRLDDTSDNDNDIGDEHSFLSSEGIGEWTGDERTNDIACCILSAQGNTMYTEL